MLPHEIRFDWPLAFRIGLGLFWRWLLVGALPGILVQQLIRSAPLAGFALQLLISFVGLCIAAKWLFGGDKVDSRIRARRSVRVHEGSTAMPKGYWVVRIDVSDPEGYKAYVAANAEPFRRYGARFVVRGGKFENPEGSSRARNVVLEFPSYQAALDCYRSPEYQAAVRLREPVATGDVVIIEGYEGPQPGDA